MFEFTLRITREAFREEKIKFYENFSNNSEVDQPEKCFPHYICFKSSHKINTVEKYQFLCIFPLNEISR